MQLRFRSLLIFVALSLFTTGLVACGGGGDENADKVLKETFRGGKDVKSFKLNAAVTFSGQGIQGLNGPVKLSLTGPFQSRGAKQFPNFDLSLVVSGGGQNFSAGAVSTGEQAFVKAQGTSYAVSNEFYQSLKRGYEQASRRPEGTPNNPSPASLGVNPLDWLKSPSNEGDADVAGASTTHIRSEIDLPKLLQGISTLLSRARSLGVSQATRQAPTQLTPQQQQQIQRIIKKASFDVYSGKDDKILRKLKLAVGFAVPQSGSQPTGGQQSGELTLDLEFRDLNKSQKITAPKNVRPFSELQSALGGLSGLSGALSALGGTSGAGGGGRTPSAQAQQAYGACILAAGNDLAKSQACAKHLK